LAIRQRTYTVIVI